MLHELVHNMIGPHNVSFYKLLDELKAECEELMAAGVRGSGNGFDAPAAGRAGGDMPWQAHQQHYDQRRATILQVCRIMVGLLVLLFPVYAYVQYKPYLYICG